MAKLLGLQAGTPVSAAIIDAHAGVPGAGVAEPDTLVMVLGTSSCHMLNRRTRSSCPASRASSTTASCPATSATRPARRPSATPSTGCAACAATKDFVQLDRQAAELPPGADGVLALDWLNGCRTPLMDGSLTGAFTGLTLRHGPEHLYRALMEATAFGLRWIVELLSDGGVPVKRFVATGGLPHHNPLLMQIYADVLGQPIAVHPSKHGPALGAAILGVLAAGPKTQRLPQLRPRRSAPWPAAIRERPNRQAPSRASKAVRCVVRGLSGPRSIDAGLSGL